jgi:L-lactate utilization protein LutB
MSEHGSTLIDNARIEEMLKQKKRMRIFLSICASCGFCADSCFLYRNYKDPRYMPSYKAINSLGKLFKRKRKVTRQMLDEMSDLIYGRCVMRRRCYCPLGIDISSMISWARTICRTQGAYERYDIDPMGRTK